MTDRTHARLFVLAALVLSLVLTLGARAFSLQVLDSADAQAAAANNRESSSVVPAARGLILDQQGRILAANRVALDVSVARRELRRQPDKGTATLARLGALLGLSAERLQGRLRNCGTPGAPAQPECWNGPSAADPIVAQDLDAARAGQILASPEEFPGVQVVSDAVRTYPGTTLAAQTLGHVGSISAQDVEADPSLAGLPGRGQAGLELQYDQALRGSAGLEQVTVDSAGHRIGSQVVQAAVPGQTLVTTLDARLQVVLATALQDAIERARNRTDPVTGRKYAADGGSAVVLDVRTGAILAIASAPTFDANIWTGGISAADYAALVDPQAGQPLLNRAVAEALAPASTFKAFSTLGALAAGYSDSAGYPCPSTYQAGGRSFRNYESRAHGTISLERSLEVSCDTVYYLLAHQLWEAEGGSDRDGGLGAIAGMAEQFGLGKATGVDLPGETAGRLASPLAKQAQWAANKDQWCARAESGYPEVTDQERADYLTALARENCADGMRWRVGDALNAAIGQGDTTTTVLQLAAGYAAIANGGTLVRPHLGKALLTADGSVARDLTPAAGTQLAVAADQLAYVREALRGVVEEGSARGAFAGFPLAEVPIAAKTGTGEVFGKQTTSWFASFAPADAPRYAIVMRVSQGGTGAYTSGRSVRQVWEALFGVQDGHADPARSVLAGGDVATGLPTFGPDGVPVAPTPVPATSGTPAPVTSTTPAPATPAPATSATPAPATSRTPAPATSGIPAPAATLPSSAGATP